MNMRRKGGGLEAIMLTHQFQIPISSSARLGCALHYFAGGSPYDIMVKFAVCYQDVLASVWIVVHAVNTFTEFHISYPSSFAMQERIASTFKKASSVDFDNCAGVIDGILIWMLKPTKEDADRAGVGQKNFLWQEGQVWVELSGCI